MAKFARVTYGTSGESEEYTYVVNDNVKKGAILNPAVEHYKSHKIFSTTGIVQELANEGTLEAQQMAQEAKANGKSVANIYTGRELGISRAKIGKNGKFAGSYSASGVPDKARKDEDTGLYAVEEGSEFELNPYISKVRQANTRAREAQLGETFDSYSKSFMKQGE